MPSPGVSSSTNLILLLKQWPNPPVETAWRDLMLRAEIPSHYASPEFFKERYLAGRSPFAVLALRDGMAVGVLTGMRGPQGTASGIPSRPQICLAPEATPGTVRRLMAGLLEASGGSGLTEVYSRDALPATSEMGFKVHAMDGPVTLDLRQSTEALFKQLNSKRRNNIRFAIKNGVEFSEASADEFVAYYHDVYSKWRDTPRKKVIGAETTFEGYERRFELTANRKLFVAKVEGKMVAGAFLRFHQGGLVEYAANSSLDEYLRLKPNEFIQWKAIEWAHSQGFKEYSLGGAGQFHREFGGTVPTIYRYWLDQTFFRRHAVRYRLVKLSKTIRRAMPALQEFKKMRLSQHR